MRIGGFTRIFARSSFEEVLDAAAGHGLEALQLNLESLGLPPMPDRLDPDLCRRVRDEAAARSLAAELDSADFGTLLQPGIVPRLSATPGRVRRRAPRLGEHNAEVYGALGVSETELASLADDGVI